MFFSFVDELRAAGIGPALKEHLTLLEALDADVVGARPEEFYWLARATFVKDEGLLDRFDLVFGKVFKGIEAQYGTEAAPIPEEWLRKVAEPYLNPEQMEEIKALGSWEEIMAALKQRLEEQKGRHQGGSKWIGTAGTSPFGAYGYNPEGVRVGQDGARPRRAVKVWDRRDYRDLDDTVELGTRGMKIALRRLRRFARQGAATELDIPDTIRSTANNAGSLDLKMVPERHNTVKVLLFLDVGGSMDDHVKLTEELFSAARTEFKHLEYYYFHNFPYEKVWKNNRRRFEEVIPTSQVLRTYGPDYKLIIVGDAAMSPYEITMQGGSVEHYNDEAGTVWLDRLSSHYRHSAWLNPTPKQSWGHVRSISMVNDLMEGRMFPLTVNGIDEMTKELSR